MEYKIYIPEYENGFHFSWENNFKLQVNIVDNTVLLSANKEGLISLARHLLNLSQKEFRTGYHFHLDEFNSLEAGSNELVIQKL